MRREMQMAMLQAERERLASHKMITAAVEVAHEQNRKAQEALSNTSVIQTLPAPPAVGVAAAAAAGARSAAAAGSFAAAAQHLEDQIAERDEKIAERDDKISSLATEIKRLQDLVTNRDRTIAAMLEQANGYNAAQDKAVADAVADRERVLDKLRQEAETRGTQVVALTRELELTRRQFADQAEAYASSVALTRKLETAAAQVNRTADGRDAAQAKLQGEMRANYESQLASVSAELKEERYQAAAAKAEVTLAMSKVAKAQAELAEVRSECAARVLRFGICWSQ